MKKKRILSVLLAVIMAMTMLPWSSLPSPLFAAGDPTDLTIDFDYEANNGVTSANDALRLLGEEGFNEHENDPHVDENYWKSSYNQFKWIPVTRWTGDLSVEGSLMKALATPGSSLHDVQYISLTAEGQG